MRFCYCCGDGAFHPPSEYFLVEVVAALHPFSEYFLVVVTAALHPLSGCRWRWLSALFRHPNSMCALFTLSLSTSWL